MRLPKVVVVVVVVGNELEGAQMQYEHLHFINITKVRDKVISSRRLVNECKRVSYGND